MLRTKLLEKWAACFSCAAVLVGLWTGTAAAARPYRGGYCPPNHCPPGYGAPSEYDVYHPSAPTPAPGQSNVLAPNSTDPNATTPNTNAATPNTTDPNQPPAPQADPTNQPQTQSDINFSATQSAGSGDVASAGSGANVGHIGRLDQNGRLNIFDSMSALPRNRAWYSFMHASRYTVGIADFNANTGVLTYQNLNADLMIHRMGAEVKLIDAVSVAFQGQQVDVQNYHANVATLKGHWSNPQAMLKGMLYQDCDVIISATVAAQFQLQRPILGELREQTSRVAPGMLFYSNTTEDIFNYGGFQFSIPTRDHISTFDWSLGTGAWLYRNDCCGAWLRGATAQFEVYGKHVMGNNAIDNAFGFNTVVGNGINGVPVGQVRGFFNEGRDVIDMTFGTTLYIRDHIQWAHGVSFPVSTQDVRNLEYTTTVGYVF